MNISRVQRRFRKLQLVLGRSENRGVANIKVLQADVAALKKSVHRIAAAQEAHSHSQEQHNRAMLLALRAIHKTTREASFSEKSFNELQQTEVQQDDGGRDAAQGWVGRGSDVGSLCDDGDGDPEASKPIDGAVAPRLQSQLTPDTSVLSSAGPALLTAETKVTFVK